MRISSVFCIILCLAFSFLVYLNWHRQPRIPSILLPFQVNLDDLPNENHDAIAAVVPTVLVPGMGDSCFNPGFAQLTSMVSTRTKQRAFCIGPGFDPVTDAINSFTKTMNEQVDDFAKG